MSGSFFCGKPVEKVTGVVSVTFIIKIKMPILSL